MDHQNYDFSGWVTRYNVRCSDQRTILPDAFKHHDGGRVPLVWNHQQTGIENVVGHIDLENRSEGVYGYGYLNHSQNGELSKELLDHGDITSLSIYANQLVQNGTEVIHGNIREVSLVLAGANPGAFIDNVIRHGENVEDEVYIFFPESEIDVSDEESVVEHADKSAASDNDGGTIKDVLVTFNEEQRTVLAIMILNALTGSNVLEENDEEDEADVENSDTKKGGKTIGEVFDTFTEEQKLVTYELIRQAIESRDSTENENKDAEHSATNDEENEGGESNMSKRNIFEQNNSENEVLSHTDIQEIIADSRRYGSLKESFIQHGIDDDTLMHAVTDDDGSTVTYGMANIDYLFPEDHLLNARPITINQNTGWVNKVMAGVHHTPFSRIKTVFADLTVNEARAKGYVKGNTKVDEVFGLLKRSTSPTTVYKKQRLDRDDIVDITGLDVVGWLKVEMRAKLNEELSRAFLIGDQRSSASDDKINEQCIRPIWTDADLFTIKAKITLPASSTDDQIAKKFIRACRKARKDYKGSGNPTLYAPEDIITDCLLMEDQVGRVIYDTEEKLATALRVKEIVTVPVMENLTRTVTTTSGSETRILFGIIVNLDDYTVGADKGGSINMFDDFDIDVNQEKYLIETRCSGALTIPASAIAVEAVFESAPEPDPDDDDEDTDVQGG